MNRSDYPYRKCLECQYIEDCPHPQVDQGGRPIPPDECVRRHEIKTVRKPIDENILIYGRPSAI